MYSSWHWVHFILQSLYFIKEFACNGTVVDHAEYGEVLQLQGDQRTNVADFLVRVSLSNQSFAIFLILNICKVFNSIFGNIAKNNSYGSELTVAPIVILCHHQSKSA